MFGHRRHHSRSHYWLQPSGFTLIEMMITVAVMAILIAIAAPYFGNVLLNMKLNSYANNLVGSVYAARSEAIKRNAVITLCASSDGTSCATSGGWEQGWIIMCNTNDNITCNSAGTSTLLIFRQLSAANGFHLNGVTLGTGTVARSVTFQPTGVGAAQTTVTACRANPIGNSERVISISATGRPSVTKTNTGVCA